MEEKISNKILEGIIIAIVVWFLSIIVYFLVFYLLLPNVTVDAKYYPIKNGSNSYHYSIDLKNNGQIDLDDVKIKISDVKSLNDNSTCYQLDLGIPVNKTTKLASCDIERAYDNVLFLNCNYLETNGDIQLDWDLYSPPRGCKFIVEYRYRWTPIPLLLKKVETEFVLEK